MAQVIELERKAYSIIEAGKILGLGRSASYRAARTGEIPVLQIGGKLLVPKVALENLLASTSIKSTR